MKVSKKFESITSYQNDNFKEWFGDMEFKPKTSKLYSKKLEKSMNDKEIQKEFNPTELTLGEVFNFLKTKAKKDDWMIFYCRDKDEKLRAVGVLWFGGGWRVLAGSLLGPVGWLAGLRVFSRNSFDTLTPKPLETSETSGIYGLNERVAKIEAWIKNFK